MTDRTPMETEMAERWSVSCRCDYHGDHLGCDDGCKDIGCRHPVGVEVTASTEAEADRLSGFTP